MSSPGVVLSGGGIVVSDGIGPGVVGAPVGSVVGGPTGVMFVGSIGVIGTAHALVAASQTWPAAQHWAPQSAPPEGHTHTPAAHVCPAPHGVPHVPQLVLLLFRSTQAPPQFISPGLQPAAHCPALHTMPPQLVPQPPQLFGSELMSAQPVLHAIWPGLHTH